MKRSFHASMPGASDPRTAARSIRIDRAPAPAPEADDGGIQHHAVSGEVSSIQRLRPPWSSGAHS